jgi:DNA-binding transcriptional ArsR family regulator/uncharacterized protein YndB with AHSA1/START domain
MALEALPGDPFDALGDEHRRAIVELLRHGDRSVQQLADALPISRPAVSRHLRLLKQAGLVTDRAEGTRRLYRLHHEGIAAVHAYLQQVWGDATTRFRLAAENLPDEQGHLAMTPLEIEFTVACTPAHAFDVWTAKTTLWWPSGHSVSTDPDLTVTFEPHAGGRIFERTSTGTEHDWGEILDWEPPHLLRYLWHLRADRRDATEVEIRFTAADDGTLVTIVHRGWERLGAAAHEWRDRNRQGWAGLLPHYERACIDLSA